MVGKIGVSVTETPALTGGISKPANTCASTHSPNRRLNRPTGVPRDMTEKGLFMWRKKIREYGVNVARHPGEITDFTREWALVGIGGSAGRLGHQSGEFLDVPHTAQETSPVNDVETGEIGIAQLQRVAGRL